MNYILISTACEFCGKTMNIKAFDHTPNKEDIYNLEQSIGGMNCITTKLFKKDLDGDYAEVEKEILK